MGIKGLTKFLRETYPSLFKTIHLSEYRYEKICVDTSLYVCNYKALHGDNWINAIIKLVVCLRENDIHPNFVYDSGFPPEKEKERKKRWDARTEADERVTCLENAIEKYNLTGEIEPILYEFQTKKKLESKRIMRNKNDNNTSLNITAIESTVKKMRKQLFTIGPEDFDLTKKVFDTMNVPYINAPMEAEACCSDLCIQNKCLAVLSEDSDVLCYGANVFLCKINTSNSTCQRVLYSDLLEATGFTKEQFIDFCIMCGCDYNQNIPKIGPKKSFALIEKYKSIEKIAETGIDVSILNHKRSRELFSDYVRCNFKVNYCGFPDFDKFNILCFQKNIKMDIQSIKNSFEPKIIIEEDEVQENEEH
jgi:flap endonuclease-1